MRMSRLAGSTKAVGFCHRTSTPNASASTRTGTSKEPLTFTGAPRPWSGCATPLIVTAPVLLIVTGEFRSDGTLPTSTI